MRVSNSKLLCMALNPLLSWLTQQLRRTHNIARDNSWEYLQQPHRHPRPAIIPGGYLVWELFLPSSCSLWPAGFQCLLCGSASLDGLYGTEESRRQLLISRQHLKPTHRALPWCCTLIAQRVLSGLTCAGARYATHACPDAPDAPYLTLLTIYRFQLNIIRTAGSIITLASTVSKPFAFLLC